MKNMLINNAPYWLIISLVIYFGVILEFLAFEPIQYTNYVNTSLKRQILLNADITKYGWTGNEMKCGGYPYVGATAVSDLDVTPCGTIVYIHGKRYVVGDLTAKWVHKKFGLTFDIYSEDTRQEMLNFGRQPTQVIAQALDK